MRCAAWISILVLSVGCGNGGSLGSVHDTDRDGGTEGSLGTGGNPFNGSDAATADGDLACHRAVSLTTVAIPHPVPFDVVIVADNSDSLSWSRDNLSSGLRNLLARVHGHEARFFVLTTTQYGESSKAAVSFNSGKDIVTWRDSVTHAAYAHPVTEYAQSCTDAQGGPMPCPTSEGPEPFTLNGAWTFQMPPPVAAITPDMTDAELSTQQQRIAEAVLALGGGGAQQEQPICTLSRYLAQKPELLPKHVVFVILTDEDDTSLPDACLAAYNVVRELRGSPMLERCDANCDEYAFYSDKPNTQERLQYRCVPVDDMGHTHPENGVDKTIVTKDGANCAGAASVECSASELARATGDCGAGFVVPSCQRICGPVQGFVYCQLSRPSNVDICTQGFDEKGTHYANLADYCTKTHGGSVGWQNCSSEGFNATSKPILVTSESATELVNAASTADMITQFKMTADRVFGTGGYSVESIVLEPSFPCPLRAGQSYAANLLQIASSPNDVFPLCQDYAPALSRIEGFASYLIQTEFPLDLTVYEDVDSVEVTNKAGAKRTLQTTDYGFDRAAKTLRIHPGVLGPEDRGLAVNIAAYCEPIAK
jgi:hypothetical protein